MASTAKMMTARVVLRKAARHFGAPDETVTVSDCADKSTGSTSDVRTGESSPAREWLYGLLPLSATTPSIALGKHFSDRHGKGTGDDALARFVAEMNGVAVALDLRETHVAGRFAPKVHPARPAFSWPMP